MDIDRKIQDLKDRLSYVCDIFGDKEDDNIRLLTAKLQDLLDKEQNLPGSVLVEEVGRLDELFDFCERKLDTVLTPMDKVRIVRHPQRICLKDILENVYDNYTEIGGRGEFNIDPSMLIARAYFTRRVGDKVINQMVMVIGQEKGHGEAFRNGGSVKPWGNAKALHYMKVAETENIPVHTFVFTPGAYPIEDWPGAAQQIARNLYEMAALRAPVISVFSEGGSGGAEAVGLADRRIMLSHGYYSVISPEGAAAIEGGLRGGDRATPELIEKCAKQLCITADDNLQNGYIDKIIQEPPLGARPNHYEFFRELRRELIQATNEAVSEVKSMKLYRAMAVRARRSDDAEAIFMRWTLSRSALSRLVELRQRKFRAMSRHARLDGTGIFKRMVASTKSSVEAVHSYLRYDLLGKQKRRLDVMVEELGAEAHLVRQKLLMPLKRTLDKTMGSETMEAKKGEEVREMLTRLSCPEDGACLVGSEWAWTSPRSQEDRTISCPNVRTHHCPDLWVPDLFGDFAGVCPSCGHHFPMEYKWYLENVFDYGESKEFNRELESMNPLNYEQFELKLDKAKEKTGLKSACITFETVIEDVEAVVAVLCAPFRGGSVGAAEGEKFIRAAERAGRKRQPFIAYVHGTAGIRIQEGVNGVIQMPRCTIAVRRYIDAGGLYLVLYDTNSYAGPVASFLGCSPYQFAVQSSNIGFAGPGVIAETTGMAIAPDYHRAYHALSRGHIHGIWDRREVKKNLHQSLLTMGGRNLYYR
ncbi:acetyl-CoA carboxylase carboxyl transferase subunit alpha/beta [Pseudodesulfovibrio sp. zrk46]|uniref:acetyl-CoA carboxylase carboxyl transferase subunit alpha/beta n=1 Tax=Pseudodesulfovibrio sp. zrk46 TaxID=2725288 RepID=UPI00144A2393|nr:acetyl-CoA carboxylase carboxyl transferase subunit alpha/beta [Pseudodesulfovibrio sp. zrk46]QJB57509.1 acetyl-CoA carboxylase carboxyl transferase subunit alpha/beta [Pseudodesulfovibrio sp. zrk46]